MFVISIAIVLTFVPMSKILVREIGEIRAERGTDKFEKSTVDRD